MKTLIKKASWLKPARVAAMITVAGLSIVAYADLRAVTSTGPAVMRGNASAVTNQYTSASGAHDRSYQGYGAADFNMEDIVSPLPLPKAPAMPLPKLPSPPGGESPGAEPSGPVMPGDSPPISPEPGPTQPPKEAPKPENTEGQKKPEQEGGNENNQKPKQDKRLSPREIQRLKDAGLDPERMKGGKSTGGRDLFKDNKGNIKIKPKSGAGPGEKTGHNINYY